MELLFPVEYEILWTDIAEWKKKNSKKQLWASLTRAGRVQALWWETHLFLPSSIRRSSSVFLCTPLNALQYHWSQAYPGKPDQKPKAKLSSSLMPEMKQCGPLLWKRACLCTCLNRETGRFETVDTDLPEELRGEAAQTQSHGVLCHLRTIKRSHVSPSAS